MRPSPVVVLLSALLACGDKDDPTTGSTTDTATDPGTDTSASATTTATTTGSTTTGNPVSCAMNTCGPGQVCVTPCCGGPAPSCTNPTPDNTCPEGQMPVPVANCEFPGACTGELCCPPVQCVPDPAFCAAPGELQCTGTQCSIGSCFGQLSGDRLDCQCA